MKPILAAILPVLAIPLFVAVSACAHSNDDAVDPLALPTKPVGTAAACDLKLAKENLCATITWETEPTEGAKGSFILKFTDAGGGLAIPSFAVAVKLWMPDMGHGSSPVTITPVDASTYRVSDVYFVMAGRWEIHVMLKTGSVVADEAVQLYDAHD